MSDLTNEHDTPSRVPRRTAIAALLGAAWFLMAPVRAIARACRTAVAADEGPFYPVDPFPETDNLLAGDGVPGQVLYLAGRVLRPDCSPASGAIVEIWQCDAGGQYDHPRAPKNKPLERGFRYFAMVGAAKDGTFTFRTLRPAPYEVFGLRRAPHIHIRVKAAGTPTFTTEMYFKGGADEQLQVSDRVFQGRGPRKGEMVVELKSAASIASRLGRSPEPGALACEYELTLG
jgi:protocatechuate 3,4-dioxygenase beta subunit